MCPELKQTSDDQGLRVISNYICGIHHITMIHIIYALIGTDKREVENGAKMKNMASPVHKDRRRLRLDALFGCSVIS